MDRIQRQSRRAKGGARRLFRIPPLKPLARAAGKLPEAEGQPLEIRVRPRLTVSRGKLRSNSGAGTPVHAASFIRKREIVLETELLGNPAELRRILTHELFHFVWLRLGNKVRRSWEEVLRLERRSNAQGELGWSSETMKSKLSAADGAGRTRRWREYACESFCDTAAWLFRESPHEEHTLAKGFRQRRRRWFEGLLARGPLPV